jgi:hypothetical protein
MSMGLIMPEARLVVMVEGWQSLLAGVEDIQPGELAWVLPAPNCYPNGNLSLLTYDGKLSSENWSDNNFGEGQYFTYVTIP